MENALLIIGTGAMACLFATRLAATGIAVTLLGTWPEGLQALRTYGVRLKEVDGSEHSFTVKATANPADCVGAHYALVLVKSWQTERAARQLRECLLSDGLALTLQNGLGNREILAKHLGANRVALGVTTLGATLLAPGYVRPGGEGIISLGSHPRLDGLASLLQVAGLAVETVLEADDLLWSKLVINAAINPLTALLRIPNGQLLNRPAAHTLMTITAQEAGAVASALGRSLIYSDPAAAAENVARRTAANHSSMLQDVQRGALTEVDAINGAIVAAGETHGISTPVNRTLWLLIKALNEKGVKK